MTFIFTYCMYSIHCAILYFEHTVAILALRVQSHVQSHAHSHDCRVCVCSADKWAWKWNTRLKWWSTVLVCYLMIWAGVIKVSCRARLWTRVAEIRSPSYPRVRNKSSGGKDLQHSAFEEKTFATWQFFKITNKLVAKNVSCASPDATKSRRME